MRVKVMCHRPRTQRLGVDSMDRELEVMVCSSERMGRAMMKDLRRAQEEMVQAGYPWPGGDAHGFQTQPDDSFYLVILE